MKKSLVAIQLETSRTSGMVGIKIVDVSLFAEAIVGDLHRGNNTAIPILEYGSPKAKSQL
ncbi:MAG: hypothetical protein HKL82_01875 [Acidimicrobiaceae bacterium]|nr:hypothetical protein [Acidimicrobiaceae bacterium]